MSAKSTPGPQVILTRLCHQCGRKGPHRLIRTGNPSTYRCVACERGARLITAAPEMEEFVERVAELDYHVKANNNRPKEILQRIEADARALIAEIATQ